MSPVEIIRTVDVDGGMLSCGLSLGDGPMVVFVHGFSVDRAMWDAQIAVLAGRAATVRYDLRGFGRSGLPSPDRNHLDDLVELLDRLALERVVVVGLSLGANVALALAAEHPERVHAAALASPGLPGRVWPTPRPPDLALAHAREHGVAAARRFWRDLPLFDSTRRRPDAFAQLTQMLDRFPGHQWASGPQSRPLPALADALEGIRVPVTVVSGACDDAGYRDIADELAARLPHSRHMVIADAGHFVNLDEPDRFNAVLTELVDDVRGQTPERLP